MWGKRTPRVISMFLAILMIANVLSGTAFAADITSDAICTLSLAERETLMSYGLTAENVSRLEAINNAMPHVTSSEELSLLIDEYHSIVDGTALVAAHTFYSSVGGTLYLEYTGELSLNNSLYTKVVYLGKVQTSSFHKMYDEKTTLLEYFQNTLIKSGIKTIAKTQADEIAALLGLSTSATSFLIGQSVNVIYHIIKNLNKNDFMDAYDRSSTGKVKLEYFTVTSSSAPYYLETLNFEPWNNNTVEVPAGYDYSWRGQTYDHEFDVDAT